ncbi:MAG TPA: cytochrome c peroxidase [Pirellulales bacterium]|nr:cytochrome c peroxidase [Pirellulales bacterium]HVC97560.1 cytochrome c peroxidase [Pirellulales bacterium]
MMRTSLSACWLTLLLAGVALAQDFPEKPPTPPLGLPKVFWPEDDAYSKHKAELGWLLYFDKRLSGDSSVSCASCHAPEKAFTDGQAVSIGIKGQKGGRSAPTVINRAYSTLQFWDGRAESLEEQAKGPIANPLEMTLEKEADKAHEASVARLKAVPGYVRRFKKVFESDKLDIDQVAKAIATFERTIYSGNAPFDRYQEGDKKAMSEAQVRGMDVFYNKATCDACHIGFNFTDGSFANIGIGMDKRGPDLGRYLVTGREEERGAFKTPTLREIEHTGPYMHDGRFKTLEQVIEHYDDGGIKNKYLDQRIKPLKLTKQDKSDLVAFLKALNGEGWRHVKEPTKEQLPR